MNWEIYKNTDKIHRKTWPKLNGTNTTSRINFSLAIICFGLLVIGES